MILKQIVEKYDVFVNIFPNNIPSALYGERMPVVRFEAGHAKGQHLSGNDQHGNGELNLRLIVK